MPGPVTSKFLQVQIFSDEIFIFFKRTGFRTGSRIKIRIQTESSGKSREIVSRALNATRAP